MLLGNSDGTRFTPFVIFKARPAKTAAVQVENLLERRGFGTRVWRDIIKISDQLDLQIHGNTKGDVQWLLLLSYSTVTMVNAQDGGTATSRWHS